MELYGVASGYEQGNAYQKRVAGSRAQRSANAVGLGDAVEKTRLDEKQTETGLDTEEKIHEGINTFEGGRAMAAAKGSYDTINNQLSKQPNTTLDSADSPEGALSSVDQHSVAPEVGAPEGVEMTDFSATAPVADEASPSSATTETSAAVDGTESGGAATVAPEGVAEGVAASAEDTLEGGAKTALKSGLKTGAKIGGKLVGATLGGLGGGLTAGFGVAADLHGGFKNMNTAQKIGNVSNIAGGSLEAIGAGAMMINPLVGGALELGGELLSIFGSTSQGVGDAKKKEANEEALKEQAQKTEEGEEQAQQQQTALKGAAASGAQTGTAFAGQQQASTQIHGSGSF